MPQDPTHASEARDPNPRINEGFFERFDDLPFHQFLGLKVHRAEKDRVTLRLHRTEQTPQGIGGSVNGGVLATMVDMAAVAAVFTDVPENVVPAGTADLQITYLRQASGDFVDAVAWVVKRGRQLCTIQVEILNPEGRCCCIGRVLYALRPLT
jgi:1,4-dihydroxy-2-naphthoyl-CoA hydrolase